MHTLTTSAAQEGDSLRERKQRATRIAIHVAAVDRVLADGLEQATVAAIAKDANISQRTFFNYFASKEDAIVGAYDDTLQAGEIQAFLTAGADGDHLLEDIATLINGVYLLSFNQSEVAMRRREVLRRYPALLGRQMDRIRQIEELVTEVVVERLERRELGFEDHEELRDYAEMLVQIGSAPFRHAARHMLRHPDREFDPEAECARSTALMLRVHREVIG